LAIFGFYGFIIFQDLPIKYLWYTKSVLIRPRFEESFIRLIYKDTVHAR